MQQSEAFEVVEYDPGWRDQFESEGVRLLEALGDRVREIEHVGSTAVEGMAARPVVDIMIGVDSLQAATQNVPALQQLGYEYLGDAGVSERLLFRKRDRGAYDVSIVVYQGDHWRRHLAVRDYLRAHPERARAVAERRRASVAELEEPSSESYREENEELFEELVDEAMEWNG